MVSMYHCVSPLAIAETANRNWVKVGILFFNLDELLKIEIEGNHLRVIRRDNIVIGDAESDADGVRTIRLAVDRSPNWVRTTSDRKKNDEWYVNLDRVPQLLAAEIQGVEGVTLVYGPDKPKSLGVSPSNDVSKKILQYVAARLKE